MTPMLTKWKAGAREYRLALIVAVAGSLALVLLIVAPSWFPAGQITSDTKASQTTAYSLPPKPEQDAPADIKTNHAPAPQKTEKHPTPQINTPSPVKAASHRQSSLATNRHMKDKNKLKHGYYIQVGAFKDVVKATKLANSLQHAGWHVQIISKKNALHAVLTGPWVTRARARNAKQKLSDKNKLKGFIIQQ